MNLWKTKDAIRKYTYRLQNMLAALDISLHEGTEDVEKILAEFCKIFRHPYSSSPCFKCPLVFEACPFPGKRKV